MKKLSFILICIFSTTPAFSVPNRLENSYRAELAFVYGDSLAKAKADPRCTTGQRDHRGEAVAVCLVALAKAKPAAQSVGREAGWAGFFGMLVAGSVVYISLDQLAKAQLHTVAGPHFEDPNPKPIQYITPMIQILVARYATYAQQLQRQAHASSNSGTKESPAQYQAATQDTLPTAAKAGEKKALTPEQQARIDKFKEVGDRLEAKNRRAVTKAIQDYPNITDEETERLAEVAQKAKRLEIAEVRRGIQKGDDLIKALIDAGLISRIEGREILRKAVDFKARKAHESNPEVRRLIKTASLDDVLTINKLIGRGMTEIGILVELGKLTPEEGIRDVLDELAEEDSNEVDDLIDRIKLSTGGELTIKDYEDISDACNFSGATLPSVRNLILPDYPIPDARENEDDLGMKKPRFEDL